MVGGAGRRRMRARQCLAPTVALGHSCQRARSWPGQTIREAVPRGGGRRGAWPDEGEAVPRPYGRPRSFMPTRSFTAGTNNSRGMASGWWAARGEGEAVPRPYGRPRSFMPMQARSRLGQTIREAWPRSGGRRGASPDEGEAVPRPYGRPRSFMPTRSFMAGTNKSRGMAPGRWAARGAAG